MPDPRYAMWFTISISGVYPVDTVKRILLEACISCRTIESTPPPGVKLIDGGGLPYKYMVYVFFKDYPSHFGPKSDLFAAIQSYLKKNDIMVSAIQHEVEHVPGEKIEFHTPGIFELLQAQELFSSLDEKYLRLMSSDCSIKKFPGESIVFHEGDQGDSLFIVLSGVISILKKSGKKDVELERSGSGSCVGEMSLLTGNPRSATMKAITDIELIEVPKESIIHVLEKKKDILQTLAESMTERQANLDSIALQDNESKNRAVKQLLGKMKSYFKV